MYYLLHEMNHAAMTPFRAVADATRLTWRNPANPLSYTPFAKQIAAGAELFERVTRRYAKPEFGLETVDLDGVEHVVRERTVWSRPFCDLVHFERYAPAGADTPARDDPKLLIVAPMSGHYATLLRGTVEAMLPHAEVHITDWRDARMVPLTEGGFDLDDYIDYVIQILEHMGPDTHVMAVCQPAVPVLAAVSRMEAEGHPDAPASMVLMGGPIDTRINPTAVNTMAEGKSIDWFERRVIMQVPWPHPGFLRRVYPGFLQLGGFMSMNLDRHVTAHHEFFEHLVEGDGDSAEKHREFYDEYLAVMDLTAEFYLQTVETVFIEHALPKGTMMHRNKPVDPSAIRRTALMTIEGENDDISGVGQTEAAHTLTPNIPDARREHLMQEKVGHYGIFNGSRFRAHIVPRVLDFIARNGKAARGATATAAQGATSAAGDATIAKDAKGDVIALDGKRATAARARRNAATSKVADEAAKPAGEAKQTKAQKDTTQKGTTQEDTLRKGTAKPAGTSTRGARATKKAAPSAPQAKTKAAKPEAKRAKAAPAKATVEPSKAVEPSRTAKPEAAKSETGAAKPAPAKAAPDAANEAPKAPVKAASGKVSPRKKALASGTAAPLVFPAPTPAKPAPVGAKADTGTEAAAGLSKTKR